MSAGAGGTTEPGNRADRARFEALEPNVRAKVAARSAVLYRSGRLTVARCWLVALNDADAGVL